MLPVHDESIAWILMRFISLSEIHEHRADFQASVESGPRGPRLVKGGDIRERKDLEGESRHALLRLAHNLRQARPACLSARAYVCAALHLREYT